MGVRLSGDAARVLYEGRHVGNLYRWSLEGRDGDWIATAKKYRLTEEATEFEFRFFLGELEIEGTGSITTEVITDGNVYRDSVGVKGSRIWITQPALA